jgi:hypothetical protein
LSPRGNVQYLCSPPGVNTLYGLEEWRGEQRISPLGDNFTPRGQSSPLGAKLRMGLWIIRGDCSYWSWDRIPPVYRVVTYKKLYWIRTHHGRQNSFLSFVGATFYTRPWGWTLTPGASF